MQTPDGIKIIPTVYQEVLALLKSDVLAAVEHLIAAERRLKMIYDDGTASMTYLRAQISVSGLTTAGIEGYLSHNKDAVIRFGLRFLGDQDATSDEQEYAEGEEQDPPGESEILGLSNGMGIKIAIYHNFLANRTPAEFIAFLKNRRIPKAAKFARDLVRVYGESQMLG
ncbi:MAG: hypothetical protein JWP89_1105 [Schlesneria sp.]|nr:hypothetical protein [Schlesneria sp.]